MSSSRWNVWSKDPSRNAWMVIDPNVSESEARTGVSRRERTAQRFRIDGAEFMALPVGQNPHQAIEAAWAALEDRDD